MNVEDFLKKNKYTVKDIKYPITKIKEKEDGVVIYLENKEKINISVDTYFNYSTNTLKGLDDGLYEILKNEEKQYLAYRGVLRKLSAKDFTVKQIDDYLKKNKELSDIEIKDIVDKLLSYGLLDDEKYCVNRVNYLNTQLLSTRLIKLKLKKEGLSSELINKYVSINEESEHDKARKIAHKYATTVKNKSENAIKQYIVNKLVRLGFSYDIAISSLDNLKLYSDSEIILLKKEYVKAKNKYEKKYVKHDLRNHIYAYLVNKGFKNEDIKEVMEDL